MSSQRKGEARDEYLERDRIRSRLRYRIQMDYPALYAALRLRYQLDREVARAAGRSARPRPQPGRAGNVPCAGTCGRLLKGSTSSLPAGQRRCHMCRRGPNSEHGLRAYWRGCRCETCTHASRDYTREWRRDRRASRLVGELTESMSHSRQGAW